MSSMQSPQRPTSGGAFLGPTRARLLATLERAPTPMTVRELADAVGLHPNSVREQLQAMVVAGLVTTARATRAARGRPSHRYAARPVTDPAEPYRVLARVLTEQLAASPDAVAASTAAGERWGRSLIADRDADRAVDGGSGASGPGTDGAPGATDAVARLVDALDLAGFAPELVDALPVADRDAATIGLLRCPFEPVGGEHRPVVCGVHLGMMRGVLRGLGAPVDAVSLEPFAAPGVCVARLGTRPPGRPGG